jgi:hypothetical protein
MIEAISLQIGFAEEICARSDGRFYILPERANRKVSAGASALNSE